jgi:mono/diheme cytochrome c family protein
LNYPVWELPAPGLLIAAVGIVHVFVSHFAVGGGLFLVLAERKARAGGDAALLGFVRALSRGFVLLTLVFGALTGVGIWFTIALVQPQATSALVTTFVWAWAIEWTFFALEIAAAIVYYHGWDRLDAQTHMAVGWIYFVAALASLVVITGILSFMMTSGRWPATRQFADGFFNPSYAPMVVLRSAGAVGLTGLYVLFAASFLSDREAKARIARWTAARWIAPAAIAVPLALVWFLSAAAHAGVAVAETLGAKDGSPLRLLQAVFTATNVGQPIVRGAARATLLATAALVVASLLLAAFRPRRYGRLEASCLMLLGLVSIGGSEWIREGLRKPWVIDRYMFVNGVRVPAAPGAPVLVQDPFALDALSRRGVLATSGWHGLPAAYRPGDPAFERLPAQEKMTLEADVGRTLFVVECAACHTERGHLGIRRLVSGKSHGATARGRRTADVVVRSRAARRELARPAHAALRGNGRGEARARDPPRSPGRRRACGARDAGLTGGGARGLRGALRRLPRAGGGLADRPAAPRPLGRRALRRDRPPAAASGGDAARSRIRSRNPPRPRSSERSCSSASSSTSSR